MNQAHQTPSYSRILRRRKELFGQRRRVEDPAVAAELRTLGEINKKDRGYAFARQAGVHPPEHEVFTSIAEALDAADRERFVLKPLRGHSSRGVYLLTARGNDSFFCLMRDRQFTRAEIVEDYAQVIRAFGADVISRKVILEDYVRDSLGFDVPLDYKVYSFHSGTPIIMQRYAPAHLPKDRWAFQFYDRSGSRLGVIRLKTKSDPAVALRPPADLDAIVAAAETLVRQARVSFVRTDLYSAEQGVVFGEFTPVPNNAAERFEPEFDRILAGYWQDSLAALGLDYFGAELAVS